MKSDNNTSIPSSGGVKLSEENYASIIASLRTDPKLRDLDESYLRNLIDSLVSRSRFADIMDSRVFDAVFGQDDDLLLILLQSMLPDLDIVSLSRIPTIIPAEGPKARSGVYDVSCRLSDGRMVNVEAQRCDRSDLRNRWAYYLANLVMRSMDKAAGHDFMSLSPCYCIVFAGYRDEHKIPSPGEMMKYFSNTGGPLVNVDSFDAVNADHLEKHRAQFLHEFKLRDSYSLELYGSQFNIIEVELNKFDSALSEIRSPRDKLLWIFKNLSKFTGDLDLRQLGGFEPLVRRLSFEQMPRKEMEQFLSEMVKEDWYKKHEEYLLKKGEEIGREEGIEEGKKLGAAAYEKSLTDALGFPMTSQDVVKYFSNLTEEEKRRVFLSKTGKDESSSE